MFTRTIFLFIPAPGADSRLAGESFLQFNREVLSLLRRREVVIVLLLFLSPCSTFALTNLLGGLGADFHASARAVSLAGGAGTFVPGLLGCSLFPVIARRLRLRSFYFANGIIGCLFTLSLVILPHVTFNFALAVFGQFLFQAVSFAIQIGIIFEAIGPDNPLAATTFAFLAAATNVPMTYLTFIGGRTYSAAGIRGMLLTDAAVGILACTVAAIVLAKFDSKAVPAREDSLVFFQRQDEESHRHYKIERTIIRVRIAEHRKQFRSASYVGWIQKVEATPARRLSARVSTAAFVRET